jgi:hypothetical protein
MFRLGKFSQLKEDIMADALTNLSMSIIVKDNNKVKVKTHTLSPTTQEITENVPTVDKELWHAVDYIEKDKACHESPLRSVDFSPKGSPGILPKTLSPRIMRDGSSATK